MKTILAALFFVAFTLSEASAAVSPNVGDDDLKPAIEKIDQVVTERRGESAVATLLQTEFNITPLFLKNQRGQVLTYGNVAVLLSVSQKLTGGLTQHNIDNVLADLQSSPAQSWKSIIDRHNGDFLAVLAQVQRLATTADAMTLEASPQILSFDPEEPKAGGELRIVGKHFGRQVGQVILHLDDPKEGLREVEAVVAKWTESEIRVKMPILKSPHATLRVKTGGIAPQVSDQLPLTVVLLETDRPFVTTFFAGVEYTLESKGDNRNFSKPFPHLGVRSSAKYLAPWSRESLDGCKVNKLRACQMRYVRGFFNARLQSVAVEETSTQQEPKLSAERSYQLEMGLSTTLWEANVYRPLGLVEIDAIAKGGGQTSETKERLFGKFFPGLRLLRTGTLFNGAYLDLGYGFGDNFNEKKWRAKLEAYLPLDDLGVNAFLLTTAESAFSGKSTDAVTISVGTFFSVDQLVGILFKKK